MIEVLFAVREDQFEENPAIPTSLDFVAEMNQLTYMLTLDSTCKPEPISDAFESDENYEENEKNIKLFEMKFLMKMNQVHWILMMKAMEKKVMLMKRKEKEKQHTIVDETETTLLKPRQEVYPILEKGIAPEKCGYILL
ncbi:unnamed protein product [Rotaria sp. Silwood2]|nr:unnamed protein product [Rotaria sp. Silwood2]CAF4430775.1 unnamed protein product [Rotaria sp. Silwood2]